MAIGHYNVKNTAITPNFKIQHPSLLNLNVKNTFKNVVTKSIIEQSVHSFLEFIGCFLKTSFAQTFPVANAKSATLNENRGFTSDNRINNLSVS